MKKKITLITLCLLVSLFPWSAKALLFDAPEFIEEKCFSTGTAAEIFLKDPTGEGIEFRLKYGFSSTLNTQLIVGAGNATRGFRLGLQNNYSIFPDLEGQVGLAVSSTILHLERENGSGLLFNAGPLLHKRLDLLPLPANFYFSTPISIEFNHGSYRTGLQLVTGAVAHMDTWFFTTELGLGIGEEQSYLALGGGFNFSSTSNSAEDIAEY